MPNDRVRLLMVGAFGSLAVISFLALLLWFIPLGLTSLEPDPQRLNAINDARTIMVQMFAGVGLFGGLVFTARTLRLNREGHITDRFSKAIEQLGHTSIDVRLGGIYALERIMRDSAADHQQIVEILTAFVRQHAQQKTDRDVQPHWKRGVVPDGLAPLDTDVQAALTVLGRRPDRQEAQRLDLRRCDLRLASLHGVRFQRAVLNDTWLDYSDLGVANLSETSLRGTGLAHAWMRSVQLDESQIVDSDFRWSHLEGSSFSGTDIRRTSFEQANLRNVINYPSVERHKGLT